MAYEGKERADLAAELSIGLSFVFLQCWFPGDLVGLLREGPFSKQKFFRNNLVSPAQCRSSLYTQARANGTKKAS